MPEYLAPGVYVEETSFRSKSIEGVSTTTTGFIGPARFGPIELEPDIITSLSEFERIYGDQRQLQFGIDAPMHNYLWHGVRAFFEEGGKRLYISRIFNPQSDSDDGRAFATIPSPASPPEDALTMRARFPGAAGNMRMRFIVRVGQNILAEATGNPVIRGLLNHDVVWIGDVTSPITSPPGSGDFYIAAYNEAQQTWIFRSATTPAGDLQLAGLDVDSGDVVRVVTVTVIVEPTDDTGVTQVWDGLPLDPRHTRAGAADSLAAKFAETPSNLAQARTLPIVVTLGNQVTSGLDVIDVLFNAQPGLQAAVENARSSDGERSVDVLLEHGNDGLRPEASDYEGAVNEASDVKTGLKQFEDLEDISIVAAPGATFGFDNGYTANARAIVNSLISHAERMRYRVAVLDSGDNESIGQVRDMRGRIDSTHAALYYPWVRILDPVTSAEIHLPPSGFVAGIYARNDIDNGVHKAPANEVVRLAIGFEKLLNKSQQDVLNPEGINAFRFFEGRGLRLWGARTISSDPEWKYINVRRYFAYLERSIDKGTQFVVFEPNGEALWGNVLRTISDFLFNEWKSGRLLGSKPEMAFFVRCDRSTMTQNDLDNGRLICLIGVAPLKPAEFVIFRIGQFTADRRS